MKITDQRVRKTNEVLEGIKVIKLYGWEDSFVKVAVNRFFEFSLFGQDILI